MGFGLNKSLGMGSIFNNPLYSAVIITIIIIIIIYFLFHSQLDEDLETSDKTKLYIKAFVYISLTTLGILSMHYNNLNKETDIAKTNAIVDNTVAMAASPAILPPPIQPGYQQMH